MGINEPIYSQSLAQLYAEQGHYRKALEIYRHLLNIQPQNRLLQFACADMEEKLRSSGKQKKPDLVSLFAEWIDLLKKCGKLKK